MKSKNTIQLEIQVCRSRIKDLDRHYVEVLKVINRLNDYVDSLPTDSIDSRKMINGNIQKLRKELISIDKTCLDLAIVRGDLYDLEELAIKREGE